jgi:type I restriction enzyme R subunit
VDTPNQNPEHKARDRIDKMLRESGWVIQDKDKINFGAGLGVAIREYQTDVGPADYVLFVSRKPVGIIEAKREEEGQKLSQVEQQSSEYGEANLKWIQKDGPLPFIHESTGIITYFTDQRDPKPRSREIFSFFRPETFQEWLSQDLTLRARLHRLPELSPAGFRECQVRAINKLEKSFKQAKPKALIQMATGAGKTFTAISFVYRLLKYAGAKRVLFLVDTKNLGEQAEQEFMAYVTSDDKRKFTELYNLQRLKSSHVAKDSQVCISTIQRLYSILKGQPLDEAAEEENPAEHQAALNKAPMPVSYSEKVPPEFFDFIVIDECHRSIYNVWKQVLDYFDAFLIGLTATPDKRTFGFFNENVVSEYTHTEAVADGVNVGHDVYVIETEITKRGARLEAKQLIEMRDKLTRKKRWEQLDEDVDYAPTKLDREVVNPSQIRNIIRTFKDKLPEIFPNRKEAPKTLIFAKTDSHADDIIRIVREEFDEGNQFCKKVTYQADEDPKSVLAQFRNDYYPRVAVTVDMIATGTDVKPLECLVFMRDVRSRNYFEQMKGRGTRTLGYDDLKKVSPSAESEKTHFVIIDAIGVTKSCKTDSGPLEKKPTVLLKDLLNGVMMGIRDDDTISSLANRLARLAHKLTPDEHKQISQKANGVGLSTIVKDLLQAIDADYIDQTARSKFNIPDRVVPSEEQLEVVQGELVNRATAVFTGELNTLIENIRREHEQTIDSINLDRVLFAGWDAAEPGKANEVVNEFSEYIKEHKDQIIALSIFFGQPYRRRELTYAMVKEVLERLRNDRPALAPVKIWQAYNELDGLKATTPQSELTALVALIRRAVGVDKTLTPYDQVVRRNFQNWVLRRHQGAGQKFTEEQMNWLRMIRDHIASSFHIEKDDLDYAPFDSAGGLGNFWRLFGEGTDQLIQELNEELAA